MEEKKPKCPVCGRYAGRKQIEMYEEMEETVHRQCVELDAWRSKYDLLIKKVEKAKSSSSYVPQEQFEALKLDRDALFRSSELMEKELDRLRKKCADLAEKERLEALEIERLWNRGLWDRIFNR